VRVSFARLRRLRIAPTRVDRIAAALLALAAELQVWLGGMATHHRLAAGLVAAALTASVAVRRAYPLGGGVAAVALMSLQVGVWGDPQVIGASIAELCALYGLTVWTSPRRFLLGTVAVTVAVLAAAAGPHTTFSSSAFVLLVRRGRACSPSPHKSARGLSLDRDDRPQRRACRCANVTCVEISPEVDRPREVCEGERTSH
jgi:hypothetical protein